VEDGVKLRRDEQPSEPRIVAVDPAPDRRSDDQYGKTYDDDEKRRH